MPKFKHQRTGRTVEATGSRADRYRRMSGWVETDEDGPDTPKPASAPPSASDTGLSVPEGSVAVVLEWAGDDPARRAAALGAELDGKNRKGIISALS